MNFPYAAILFIIVAICGFNSPAASQPIKSEFGFLEDIENEIIKDTMKSTVKSLIENAENAVNSGKDFDEVLQKLGETETDLSIKPERVDLQKVGKTGLN